MIKAIIFDLDNTLVDFMLLKRAKHRCNIPAMIDAGWKYSFDETKEFINKIYESEGIEYQQVFDKMHTELLGES
ncbi:MAG: hypothetical protein R3A12_06860 [Ignavibacteria bacterium]